MVRLSLSLTPHGALRCEPSLDAPEFDDKVASRLSDAFAQGSGAGLLRLGAGEVGQALPPVFAWWRGFAGRFVAALCQAPEAAARGTEVAVSAAGSPSQAELATLVLNAPMMPGLAAIPPDPVRHRRLARDSYGFASGLPIAPSGGLRRIVRLSDAVPSDIVAWQHRDQAKDTGHVFMVAAVVDDASSIASVAVYDSSNVIHDDDSRGPGKPFADGVGTGSISFHLDGDEAPDQVRFAMRDRFHAAPVTIARIEPFSAG